MTNSYKGSFRWRRDKGPWPFWWGPSSLRGFKGTDTPGCITEPLLSVPEGDDYAAANTRHTLDALGLELVVEARSRGQRMVILSAWGPGPAVVDVIGEVVHDYGWKLLASSKHSLKVVGWPRLLEHLSSPLDGQPVLDPVSTWDQARQSLLRSATSHALVGALLQHQEACSAMWQDLWSQCCEGGCVPSRWVLPLHCCGCGKTTPVWVHQCASIPLCGSWRERAGRGWPKARWALRHSGQLSSSAWKAIQRNVRGVRVDGVRCPSEPTAALPLLLWWAALDGDSRVLWLWHYRGPCGEAASVGGDAAWPDARVVDGPGVIHLVDTTAVVVFEKWSPTGVRVRQRQTVCDSQRDVAGRAGLIVSRTASAHAVQLEM